MTTGTPGAAVSFESADVWVDSQRLVGPLTLDVARSETLVLLGRSGSGKTTTLRLVNGLLTPSHGTVLVEGRATSAWDPIRLRRRIGYVIQDIGLFPHLTVADNVAIVPRLERWSAERIEHRVPELLDLVGLDAEEYGARHPHQLSGGQRQRVGVARALAADPPILLCDEPFGAVDPITRADLQREFSRLTHALDKTVLFVTHDVREALIVGTRIALFEDGQIVFLGSVAEFRDSADPHVQAFMESA